VRIPVILLFVVAMLGPAFVVVHLPLVPNWPYVGVIFGVLSLLAAVVYLMVVVRRLKAMKPLTTALVLRLFPFWLAVFSLFWSWLLITTEKNNSLQFAEGRVVEKYRSSNHGYLSVWVAVDGRGTVACEGLSPETWEAISPGSKVAKRCGSRDIVVVTP
jgi:hypothetical protein